MSVQATFAATLVDEWARGGLTHAVVAPGSRSTPLALALADAAHAGRLVLHVRLDERSAGFFALGLGLATGRPAVVLTTSGTAAVELHPAVVEAHQAGVPLLACTADRPPELHHVGAPQTVEQEALFGKALRWAVAPGVPEAGLAGTWRSLAARALAEAVAGPGGPGPVHVNLAFRDPLGGRPGPLPEGRPGGRPWHRVATTVPPPAPAVVAEVAGWRGRRGVVVAGAGAGDAEAVHALARALGWPVLAEPRSGARLGRAGTVAAADALLRVAAWAQRHRPEVVLRLGAPWASKVLGSWLAWAGSEGEDVLVDPRWGWVDPDRRASLVVVADPSELCRAVVGALEGGPAGPGADGLSGPAPADGLSGPAPRPADGAGGWWEGWVEAEASAQAAIEGVLARHPEPTEPGVARHLLAWLPEESTLAVASSMPVRDLEWFGAARSRPPRVVANRGANGIDGMVSTVLGLAAGAGPQAASRAGEPSRETEGTGHAGPVVGLLGDLAFLHDAGALVGAAAGGLAATLVVVDNGGGGIFSFLGQAQELAKDRFEQLFGTPQDADVAEVARAYGTEVTEVARAADLVPAVEEAAASGTVRVVRVRTNRDANVAVHAEIEASVAAAIARLM